MPDSISVDVAAMLAAATEFENKHDNIRSQVTSVQNEFDALSATWGGDAATQFQNAMHVFYDECNTVLVNLQQIAADVDNSAINYDKTHHLSVDAAAALQKRIGATPAGLPGF